MAKRKKRNNIVQHRDWFYCRLRWYNEYGRQVECKVNLYTKKESHAIERAKRVQKDIEYIKNGTIQRFQFDDWFEFRNDEGTSTLVKKSLQDTIDEYLEYRSFMVKPKTFKRDKSALNQLRRLVGSNKAVKELSYRDIEGKHGLIKYLRSKKCTVVGINTTLRHIRPYFNWLHYKEKIIPEPIKFKLLPEGMKLYHYFNEGETNQIYHYINEHMDSSYLRYYHFYNQTGMRPTEPFIGELVGDWYLINGEDRKNGIPMQMQLNDELKSILLEMQSFRDTKLHCKDANVRVVDILERVVMNIVRTLELTGKRLTLYSFRHSYAIRRITMLNGNVFEVMREMGHTNTQTTMQYLRFPLQRRLDDFPSLQEYVQNPQEMQKSTIMGTKIMGTNNNSIPNLLGSSDA